MTYVAEPYLYVADQILTGLTGGVARETHRFFAGANAFSFEVGADRKLADYRQIVSYFRAVAAASPRVKIESLGGWYAQNFVGARRL